MVRYTKGKPSWLLPRGARSCAMRFAIALLLIPLMVLSAFGGTAFLTHHHDELESHFHAFGGEVRCISAAEHRAAHRMQSPVGDPALCTTEGDGPEMLNESEGLSFRIPDHEQMVVRGVDVLATLSAVRFVQFVLAVVWKQPEVSEDTGSPGGRERVGAWHLCALFACERLVRTSQALLI